MSENTFTPVFDEICKITGPVAAMVYGVVWRYCQMADEVCYAAHDTIGLRIGLNRRTVARHLAMLEADGWIIDLTPDYRNAPHTYQVTDRLARIKAGGAGPASQSGATERPSGCDSLTHQAEPAATESHSGVTESPDRCDCESQPSVTESRMNQTLKRDSLTKKKERDKKEEEVAIPEWGQVMNMLEFQFGRSTYAGWFPGLRPVSFDGAVLIVAAADAYQCELLNARLAHSASTILSGIFNLPGARVEFVVGK